MKRSLLLWAWLLFGCLPVCADEPVGQNPFVEAPYDCFVLKHYGYKSRFSDLRPSGLFSLYKVEFINRDRVEHRLDYGCFCLVDEEGYEYEVNTPVTIVRETRGEDWRIRDVDNSGFNSKSLRPNFSLKGWLIFDVPKKEADYHIKFRGYIK